MDYFMARAAKKLADTPQEIREAQARAADQAEQDRLRRETKVPGHYRPQPTASPPKVDPATAEQIRQTLVQLELPRFPLAAFDRHNTWRKLAGHGLTETDWWQIGMGACRANETTAKIRCYWAYLDKCALNVRSEAPALAA